MLSEPGFLPLFLLCALGSLRVEIRNAQHRVRRVSERTTEKACTLQMRGTSGTPRRTKRSRYRCSLPGLAGFAGLRRTEPEVPRIGSRACKLRLRRKSSTALRSKKENRARFEEVFPISISFATPDPAHRKEISKWPSRNLHGRSAGRVVTLSEHATGDLRPRSACRAVSCA